MSCASTLFYKIMKKIGTKVWKQLNVTKAKCTNALSPSPFTDKKSSPCLEDPSMLGNTCNPNPGLQMCWRRAIPPLYFFFFACLPTIATDMS